MKLEDQVCSLELAKQLNELGVKQESLFYWWNSEGKEYVSDQYRMNDSWVDYVKTSSAFTVAELGEMLGDYNDTDTVFKIKPKTEADYRAKLLIYLIEEKIINIEE